MTVTWQVEVASPEHWRKWHWLTGAAKRLMGALAGGTGEVCRHNEINVVKIKQ